MTKCPYCGEQNNDGSLFCTECGKPIPHGKVCHYCGASVNDNDVFCQNCGKRIVEKPLQTSTEAPHDVSANRDNIEVQVNRNENNKTKEYDYNASREKNLYTIAGMIIIVALVACVWSYYSSSQRAEREIALADSIEKVRQDSIAQVRHARRMERAQQDSIYKAQQEEKEFLENFYKGLDNCSDDRLLAYIQKNVTNRAFSFLKDEFPYEDGCDECYATWMFTYEAGGDYEKLLSRKIEKESDNTFLVTNTWGYEHDSSDKTDYKVRLGIVKEGDSYKINTIVNVSEEEREKLYREINQYSRYIGRWTLSRTTDEGRKMLIEVMLKDNHSGYFAVFHVRGNKADVIAYEDYPQCILDDGVIYMTKNGDITNGTPKLRVGTDGLYSFDNEKYVRESK